MAFNIRATLQAVASFVQANGHFSKVEIGEPKNPPSEQMSAAIIADSVFIVSLTLSKTVEVHTAIIRLYMNMLQEPTSDIEFKMARAVSKISLDLLGDFDLGGTIRNVDAAGQHGEPLTTKWGYSLVGGTMFRTADMSVPLIVDDAHTLVK